MVQVCGAEAPRWQGFGCQGELGCECWPSQLISLGSIEVHGLFGDEAGEGPEPPKQSWAFAEWIGARKKTVGIVWGGAKRKGWPERELGTRCPPEMACLSWNGLPRERHHSDHILDSYDCFLYGNGFVFITSWILQAYTWRCMYVSTCRKKVWNYSHKKCY